MCIEIRISPRKAGFQLQCLLACPTIDKNNCQNGKNKVGFLFWPVCVFATVCEHFSVILHQIHNCVVFRLLPRNGIECKSDVILSIVGVSLSRQRQADSVKEFEKSLLFHL